MAPLDRYAILYMAGLAIALFMPVIILLIVASLRLRDYREPRDPVRRLWNIERGRRAQSEQYNPAASPWRRHDEA